MKIIETGGLLRPGIMSMVGAITEETLDRYYVNKAIIGCKALDPELGTFEPHEQESVIKRKMRKNAKTVILVADHTKFGKKSFIRTLRTEEIDILITDEPLENEVERSMKARGIRVIYA